MNSSKKQHSLTIINLLLIVAMVLGGVALNVSPVQAAVSAVEINSPTNAVPATVKSGGELEVKFTVTAAIGDVVDYEILLGTTAFTGTFTATAASNLVTETIVVPTLDGGSYDLQVMAKAKTQLVWISSPEQAGAVIVDNTPPETPELTAPNGGEFWRVGTVETIVWEEYTLETGATISLYYSANGGSTWLEIDDEVSAEEVVTESGETSYDWNIPPVVTTEALVKIVVTDVAGNTAEDQSAEVFTIYGVDNKAPEVEMTAPDPDEISAPVITGEEYSLKADATHFGSGIASVLFQYSLDEGETWLDAGAGSFVEVGVGDVEVWQLDFDTTSLPDGDVQFRAIATNGVGLSTTSDPSAAVIDNSAPIIHSFNLADGDWVGVEFEFEVTASDVSGITAMSVYQFLDGSEDWEETAVCSVVAGDPDASDMYTLKCKDTTGALSEEATDIKVEVTDEVDNTAEEIRTVQVDLFPPNVADGALTAPKDNAVLKIGSEVAITWETDIESIDDDNLGETPISLELRRDVAECDVESFLVLAEAAGVDFVTVPALNGARAVVTLVAVLADDLPITPGSFTWTVAGVPAVDYDVCVVVSDLAGNTDEDCNSLITIWGTDATPPVVSLNPIESPNTDKIELSATAADPESGIQQVEFFVKLNKVGEDYESVGKDTTAPYYDVEWDTTEIEISEPYNPVYPDGEYMIKAVATNGLGLTAEHEIGLVLIDNTDPEVEDLSRAGNIYKVSASDAGSGIASVVFEYFVPSDEAGEWVEFGEGVLNPVTEKYESPAWVNVDGVDVRAVATDNVGLSTESAAYEPDADIDLAEGWNLISLPLIPDAPAIDDVLADLIARGSVAQVVAWPYDVDLGRIVEMRWNGVQLTDITDIEDGPGYWVQMTKPGVLVFDGVPMVEPGQHPHEYNVYAGWNLIGFKSQTECTTAEECTTAAEYLGPDVSDSMRMMYGYDEDNGLYETITLTDGLEPGSGYWLAVSTNGTIFPPAE